MAPRSRTARSAGAAPYIWCPRSFFFKAEDGIRALYVPGVQTCALPISVAGSMRAFAIWPHSLCGQIAKARIDPATGKPALDRNNRPLTGLQIIRGMQADGAGKWRSEERRGGREGGVRGGGCQR